MSNASRPDAPRDRSRPDPQAASRAWRKPGFELIPLDCEITAYAPDGDSPLL